MKSIQPLWNIFPEIKVDFTSLWKNFVSDGMQEETGMNRSFPAITSVFSQFPEGVSNFNKVTVESV